MNPINNHESDADMGKMFDKVPQRISRAMAHVSQVAARAKNRHKRKQR